MGFFSSLFKSTPPPPPQKTQLKIMGLGASAVDYIINDSGVDGLLRGSLVLSDQLGLSFRGGKHQRGGNILAAVALADLPESSPLKKFSPELAGTSALLMQPLVDRMLYAAMAEIKKQSPEFAALPLGSMMG